MGYSDEIEMIGRIILTIKSRKLPIGFLDMAKAFARAIRETIWERLLIETKRKESGK